MKDPTEIRHNRTGIASSPALSKEMIEDAARFSPESRLEGLPLDAAREASILQAGPAATMPKPAGLGEVAKSVLQTLRGHHAAVLLDAVGARLAYERTGSRFYEALLTKARVLGPEEGGPTTADLSEIWNDEVAHFQILQDCVEILGGDPTAVTPCANLEMVLSRGPLDVASDPRMNMRESLHAALLVELADNDSWQLLIRLARRFGQEELAARFDECLAAEERHLHRVRAWHTALTERLAGTETEADAEQAAAADEEPPSLAA